MRRRERVGATYAPSQVAHVALSGSVAGKEGWHCRKLYMWVVSTVALTTCVCFLLPTHAPLPWTGRNNEFCYVNEFIASENFRPVVNATPDSGRLSAINIDSYVHSGQPFLVSGVSRDWPATRKWNHSYFVDIFEEHTLFSSTFSTVKQPSLREGGPEEVYYGIFLNDPALAALVATHYQIGRAHV